jgi:hypothetical protein
MGRVCSVAILGLRMPRLWVSTLKANSRLRAASLRARRAEPAFRFIMLFAVSLCHLWVYPVLRRPRLVFSSRAMTRRQRPPGGLPSLRGRPINGGM